MTPETWQQIKTIFQSALELDPAERAPFLREACAGDPSLRAQVESLVESHERAGDFIAEPAFAGARLSPEAEDGAGSLAGRRVGSYDIARELGRGGMGAVYLGIRADAQFDKQVAIKIVKRGMDTEFVLRRFSRERQVLAALDHPNIAKLLDGGVTDDGLPYFVMEYIEGLPINAYCDERRLSITERLKLFREVCSAVSYAHRNLVVHRDLKPSNILVTRDGTPKLLDFGIAKLLNPTLPVQTVDQTGTLMRLMTPAYASPEQVQGLPITTGSDVYSLGVLLYELLTGRQPYPLKSGTPEEIVRAVCEVEPERPSTAVSRVEDVAATEAVLAAAATLSPARVATTRATDPARLRRRLSGDLDNIILKAMRKEPPRRYGSAEQLSEDIRLHLEGLPVTARRDSFAYRGGKFLRRHRAGAAAACLLLVSLAAGVGTTFWQAHRANVERARAERRFQDVRKLANSFLFEFHDAIKDLPGSTSARELLTKRALEYLDGLAHEAGNDPSLQRELAGAYLKVGDVQGNPYDSNLGDTAGALDSYRKALAIYEALGGGNSPDKKLRSELAKTHINLAQTLDRTGKGAEALEHFSKAQAIFERIVAEDAADSEARHNLSKSYGNAAKVIAKTGDTTAALNSLQKAQAIDEELAAAEPANDDFRRSLWLDERDTGTLLFRSGDIDGALDRYRKALAISEARASAAPSNMKTRGDLASAYNDMCQALKKKGETAAALDYARKALAIFEGNAAADPHDAQAQRDLAVAYSWLGEVLIAAKNPAQALTSYRKSAAITEAMMAASPANIQARRDTATNYSDISDTLVKLGQPGEAYDYSRKALTLREPLPTIDPANAVFRSEIAMSYAQLGDVSAEIAASAGLSPARRKRRWQEARDWYQKGLDVYQDLDRRNQLSKRRAQEVDAVKRGLEKCDAALARPAR